MQLLWSEQREHVSYLHHAPSRGRGGCPWESHLISSSLHVINLLAQCYCSTGHSSSFREKGIDQASLGNAVMCVVSRKRKTEKNLSRVYKKSFLESGCSAYVQRHACMGWPGVLVYPGQSWFWALYPVSRQTSTETVFSPSFYVRPWRAVFFLFLFFY